MQWRQNEFHSVGLYCRLSLQRFMVRKLFEQLTYRLTFLSAARQFSTSQSIYISFLVISAIWVLIYTAAACRKFKKSAVGPDDDDD